MSPSDPHLNVTGAAGPPTTTVSTSPADWSKLGLDGNPLPGNPQVLQQIVDDFTYLRDTAWSVSQGLDAFVASASSGGFAGATADAFRDVVSGRLKTFVFNIARAFSLAGEAVAEYKLALVQAQQVANDAFTKTNGVAAGDTKLTGLKSQVQDQLDQVSNAAQNMEAALRDAADMVSQPIKVPSLWERIHKKVELVLSIVAGALALLSALIDGPIGVALAAAAFGAGAADFVMTGVDYVRHEASWKDLLLSGIGLLMPGGRGMFGMEALGGAARSIVSGASRAWDMVRAPMQLAGALGRGAVAAGRAAVDLAAATGRGLLLLPSALWRAVTALPSVLRGIPGFVRGVWQSTSAAVAEDFAGMLTRYPRLAGIAQTLGAVGKGGMYLGVNAARVAAALVTPLRFAEIAEMGFRGAWAPLREAASWSKGIADFRAGWAGYGRLGAAGKGLVAAGLHEVGLAGMHEGDAGWHAGGAGLREPQLAPILAGMRWDRMLGSLEKLPEGEFQQLLVGASGIVQSFMGVAPPLVREAGLPGLREQEFASLVAVAYVLHTQGEGAAQVLAGALAKELGGIPLHGLVGGAPVIEPVLGQTVERTVFPGETSGTKLWVPGTSGPGELPGLEGLGAGMGAREHAPLVPVAPAPSWLRQHLDLTVLETGAIPTHSGVLVPIENVFTPLAMQTLERIGKEGLPPEAVEQLFKQVPGEDHVATPVTVPAHVSDPQQTLELLKSAVVTTPETVHSAPPRILFEAMSGPQGPEHLLTSMRALETTVGHIGISEPGHALMGTELMGTELHNRIEVALQHIPEPLTVTAFEHSSQGAHLDGFRVVGRPEGGAVAVHEATGLRTVFEVVEGRGLEWTSREFRL
ncbi:MAG: hypothetical protein JO362_13430, partial [Streptomycetaceae bacterium]|nr:hypothetical protein [Streptomycetaceae bacterium]